MLPSSRTPIVRPVAGSVSNQAVVSTPFSTTPRAGTRRLRSNAAAWRVVELLPRHLVLTGPLVAAELAIPQKSANAALRDLVGAGVLVEHGTVPPAGRGRPSRLYTSPELLGLAGATPLRA